MGLRLHLSVVLDVKIGIVFPIGIILLQKMYTQEGARNRIDLLHHIVVIPGDALHRVQNWLLHQQNQLYRTVGVEDFTVLLQ